MSFLSILVALLGMLLLVVIHELSHFAAAKMFGMRVSRFSIGFGPPLIQFRPKNSETTFQLCLIPALAYVEIAGLNPFEEADHTDPSLFPNKSVFARAVTIAAGPIGNYLTASVLVFGLAIAGWPTDKPTHPMVIDEVTQGSPAEKAGLQSGDVVVSANGRQVKDVKDLIQANSSREGVSTTYLVERNGVRLPPMQMSPIRRHGRPVLGVIARTDRTYVKKSVGEAAVLAIAFPFQATMEQLVGIVDMIRERTTEGISGPLGMGKVVAESANKGVVEYLSILMMLSVALGMFNLLPFPALDGGRLFFLGYEVVTQKRPNLHLEALVHAVGMAFLLLIFVLVTFRDMMG